MIALEHKDRRCWRYRRQPDGRIESEIFTSPDVVPEAEGWEDSPANCGEHVAPAAPKRPGRPPKGGTVAREDADL